MSFPVLQFLNDIKKKKRSKVENPKSLYFESGNLNKVRSKSGSSFRLL